MLRATARRFHGALRLQSGDGTITVGGSVRPMIPSNEILHKPAALRDRLDADGYLYFKRVVQRDIVTAARMDVARQLEANEWCLPNNTGEEEWAVRANPQRPAAMTAGFRVTERMSSVCGGPAVMAIVRGVFGGQVLALPHYGLEMSEPGERHGFWMPYTQAARGTKLLLNAWLPLQDVPLSSGALIVAEGSNSTEAYAGVRKTYGCHDVEAGDVHGDGCFSHDPAELDRYGCPLVSTCFEAGDVVLTTVFTMQGFLTNVSDAWRLSMTSSWMMDGDDVGPDPRFATPTSPGLSTWLQQRDDKRRYPRSMDAAKADWGLLTKT